jgi:hypothetical protein
MVIQMAARLTQPCAIGVVVLPLRAWVEPVLAPRILFARR